MQTTAPAAAAHTGWARPVQEATPVAPRLPRRWPRRLLVTVITLLLTVEMLLTIAPAWRIEPAAVAGGVSAAPRLGGGPVGTALAALVAPGGGDLAAAVPPGFAEFRGYTPVPERFSDGTVRMVNPDGACSVPGGGTRFRFDAACRAHDYGYDLLRYAHARGERLPDDARKAIDGTFASDLRAHCEVTRTGLARLGCKATAEVFAAGTGVNSWRQGYGNPGEESVPVWALAALAPVAAAPLALRGRRRSATRRVPAAVATTHVPAPPAIPAPSSAVWTISRPYPTQEPAR